MLKTHFMEEDIFVEEIESLGLIICNEMNLMAFVGQAFTQFCGDNARSAKGRITNNANAHFYDFENSELPRNPFPFSSSSRSRSWIFKAFVEMMVSYVEIIKDPAKSRMLRAKTTLASV